MENFIKDFLSVMFVAEVIFMGISLFYRDCLRRYIFVDCICMFRVIPAIAESWRRNWEQVVLFFAYPPDVRKIIKNRGYFPNDDAVSKLLYLALPQPGRLR